MMGESAAEASNSLGDGSRGVASSWGWGMPTFSDANRYAGLSDSEDDEVSSGPSVPSMAAAVPSRRYSLPANFVGPLLDSVARPQVQEAPPLVSKVAKLKDRVMATKEEMLELRQETSDLQEYSNAKISRLTRYLGVLADKARKLDQVVLNFEERIAPVKQERKKLFNDLLAVKGNIRVFCRVRPQFEDEGPSATAFPDNYTLRINPSPPDFGGIPTPRKECEFDRVYGPHVGQAELFHDIQPLVQSAIDGYNVSIFAYGQTGAGKTHTMEGPSHDRGIYSRVFDELFDLSNADISPTTRYTFDLTMYELHNEQVRDLLATPSEGTRGDELIQIHIESPTDFAQTFERGSQNRAVDAVKSQRQNRSHLVVTIHVRYSDSLSGEKQYSKLSMIDMAGSERLSLAESSGNRLTESLHVNKSLSALGDVLSAVTAKKDHIPYGNSNLTQMLADSLGGDSKTVVIVHLSPSFADVQETFSSLNFSGRAKNIEISIGNRETVKKWRDMATEARKEVTERENEVAGLKQEILQLKESLSEADSQCLLLFNEVQKAWKVSSNLQADIGTYETRLNKLKVENNELAEKQKLDRDHIDQLKRQISQLSKAENDQKAYISESMLAEIQKVDRDHIDQLKRQISQLSKVEKDQKTQLSETISKSEYLQSKVKDLEQQLVDALSAVKLSEIAAAAAPSLKSASEKSEMRRAMEQRDDTTSTNKKLEEELSKRDELIERLHQENEKLFERLTEKTVANLSSPNVSMLSPKVPRLDSGRVDDFTLDSSFRMAKPPPSPSKPSPVSTTQDVKASAASSPGTVAVTSSESTKTTPAGEYLTAALMDFNPEQFEGADAVADAANKLLMLVLAAVIKAGAVREHDMLAEIRGAVFAFIRKMEPRRVMDTMLVSRVRILYIRSLLSRSTELQTIKVPAVDRFLEKPGGGGGRSSRGGRGASPARSPMASGELHNHARKDLGGDHVQPFRVNLKQEKKSKFSSMVLKLRGIDQEVWKQHVTGAKLRETSEEARSYAMGNKYLAALFVHSPAGELQRQIRSWLAESFDFLSLTGEGGTAATGGGNLEALATAIMDGWMAGLGVPQRPSTDALGQLLSDYTKRVYTSQLQHLKDVAATLATEEAEDSAQIAKLRGALESVEHKRRKVLQQMRADVALLTKEEGGSPLRNPSTASEDARVASLISLEDILKQAEEIRREAPHKAVQVAKKRTMLNRLNALTDRMPTLLPIDHPCAQKYIAEAQKSVEAVAEQKEGPHHSRGDKSMDGIAAELSSGSGDWGDSSANVDGDVVQWSVLQFNNGSATPFVIKCGATPSLELVIKAQSKAGDRELVSVVPPPSALGGLAIDEIKQHLSNLPEAFLQLALARSADGTRARYARLYKTLAVRVPALKNTLADSSSPKSVGDSGRRQGSKRYSDPDLLANGHY